MAQRYRKIDPRFWTDERVSKLRSDEILVALYCFTGTQTNRIGLYWLSLPLAGQQTRLGGTFAKGFEKVRERLRLGWDEGTQVVYLPRWWKYNCPENPNVLKACLADLHDLPRSKLIQEFSANLQYLPETFHQTFRATVERFGLTFGERMADQEQEQEQEQEKDTLSRAPARAEGFETFWQAYPPHRRKEKADALKAWQQVAKGNGFPAQALEALERQKKSEDWLRDDGRYVPYPGKWLRRHRWLDEIPSEKEAYGLDR